MPSSRWGSEVSRQVAGKALDYSFHLRDSGTELKDWDCDKELMLTRFCGNSRDVIVARLADVRRRGDPVQYAAEFSWALSQEPLPSDDLGRMFKANLPGGVLLALTMDGRKHQTNIKHSFSLFNSSFSCRFCCCCCCLQEEEERRNKEHLMKTVLLPNSFSISSVSCCRSVGGTAA